MGSAPPPIIVNSGPGTAAISSGPLPPIPGTSSATQAAATGGLTVRHVESASVDADQAFIVTQIQTVPVGPGPFSGGVTARQQEQVSTALTAIGVKKDDINFETGGNYGPFSTISVPVPVKELATRGKQVADAIENALGSRPQSGARFGISDCRTTLEPLRKKALDGVNEDAKALATASGVTLGALRSVTQSLTQGGAINGPPTDPCVGGSRPPGSTLLALDAEPKVTLNLQIDATYAIGSGDPQGGLSVSGSGKATAKADEAYVVVTVYSSSPGPFGPSPVTKKQRDEVIAKLKTLKVDEDDIQIEPVSTGPGATLVSAEVPLADLAKSGKDIVAAVEEVLGRSQNQGAWFTHSNCQAVLAEARKQALADAKRSADALAATASIKIGSMTSLSEGPTPGLGGVVSPYAATVVDPCSDNVARVFQGNIGPLAGANLKAFDATPEFTINSTVTVTYAIQP